MSDMSKLPKWAQAEFEKLQKERDLLAAFHRTQPVEPDIDVPTKGTVQGYSFNAHTGVVNFSISSPIGHGINRFEDGPCLRTTSQRPIRQYSTALLAAKAMRYVVEQECAKRLANIDYLIERFKLKWRKNE